MIPDFQSLMLPFMQFCADGKEHTARETIDALAKQFNLTEEEKRERVPSGQQEVFTNRVSWAKSHLKMAGLIEVPTRYSHRITERGKQALSGKPEKINLKFLTQFPDYTEWRSQRKTGAKPGTAISDNDVESSATPEEILENSYLAIRETLALEILAKIKASHPSFFENLVVDLLVKMGYGGTIAEAGRSVGRSGDEGIDGIIKEDRLGLDVIYIQAKRWEDVVGRPEIHKFVGALAGQGAKKGVFITTSTFTREAREYQPKNETKIVLIDGEQLAGLMIDYDLAVATTHTFTIKRIDNDYFGEE